MFECIRMPDTSKICSKLHILIHTSLNKTDNNHEDITLYVILFYGYVNKFQKIEHFIDKSVILKILK